MNIDLKTAFTYIKPLCDKVMASPSPKTIKALVDRIDEINLTTLQEIQLYVLFPIVTHLRSSEITSKYELQRKLVDAMKLVLEKVQVSSLEMYTNYNGCLLGLVFDKGRQCMVADVPEEIKLSVIQCLTVLMLSLDTKCALSVFKNKHPVQVIFISAQIARLDKLRALRLSAMQCLLAHTGTHDKFLDDEHHGRDKELAEVAAKLVSSILPGLMAALQDVANCTENPGHAVVVAAINVIHRILCLVMNDRHLAVQKDASINDFVKLLHMKANINTDPHKSCTDFVKMSPEWFAMAGEKLKIVTESLMPLQTHEHYKVKKELAVFCSTLLLQCSRTMQPSASSVLNTLIALSKDEYPEVSLYCTTVLSKYFSETKQETIVQTLDGLADNFMATLLSLPRKLNNVDSRKKLSSLDLLHGYLTIFCESSHPQQLTNILSLHSNLQHLCSTLLEAVKLDATVCVLSQIAIRDISMPTPSGSPWCKPRHLDDQHCITRVREICSLLGEAECADFIVDELLDRFEDSLDDRKEIVLLLNWIGSAPKSNPSTAKRIISKYIEDNVWYTPLEVASQDEPITSAETLDLSVYNPRAWEKDSVPGLFEGAIETRYTEISYAEPKIPRRMDPNFCSTLAEAQNNMVLSCLLTEGVGILAKRLMDEFQPYLLKTLSLILERVGSQYEMLHLAGLKCLHDIRIACGSEDVPELIRTNADYFTYQVTTRLKKAWNSQSALKILTVVMEYSNASILDCLHGIVTDVLIQSCDKYHENELCAYLQVFLTFVTCIRKWFPDEGNANSTDKCQNDNLGNEEKESQELIKNNEEFERLLNAPDDLDAGKSAEEMYLEDLKRKKEEDVLDYDDRVTEEKQPPPQHVTLTITILKRCLNFIPSKRREEKLLSLQIINEGLKVLRSHEDELLPLVHLVWAPLVQRFEEITQPVVLRRALELLVTMADLSKDFIRHRTVKEVLPNLYISLQASSRESYLKDIGSAYRQSPAFKLQISALTALPSLVVDLSLDDKHLEGAMRCVEPYLSNKQPVPLQMLAVNFFKAMLQYDYGATWCRLRSLCNNQCTIQPPKIEGLESCIAIGTTFEPLDSSFKKNINLIFGINT